ncbi:MAG: hypothetical protein M0Z31_00800 [Clostridia bacterium]|nr:hypothetical protein [Clostridia bacterium]
MIVDQPGSHFVFVFSSRYVYANEHYICYKGKALTNKEYLENWGKWVVLGTREEINIMVEKLNSYVENKQIPCIKFDRKPIKEFKNILLTECVMCVYCDVRQSEEVWKILANAGIKTKAWVFERETMKKWLPGGVLLENWISERGIVGDAAEKIRKEAQDYFQTMFEDEDAIFQGIIQ